MTAFDQIKALLPQISLAEQDDLIGMMLDEAGPCATGGHNYVKAGIVKGKEGFFAGTPDKAHMICKRCAKRITITLT